MGKGKHWLLTEDTALAEAWVQVAEEAQTGPDDTFWGAVHENWVERLGGSQRSQQALKNHWAFVQRAVRTFGRYVQVAMHEGSDNDSAESDSAESDATSKPVSAEVTELALRLHLEGEGESFALVPVWAVLHKSAKWHSSKTPGSALKRSRAGAGAGFRLDMTKANKRMSLPAGIGNGLPLIATPEPAVVPVAPRARARAPLPVARAVASRNNSSISVRSSSTERLSDTDDAAAEVVQMISLANAPVRDAAAAAERDSHAASIATLAAAQRERNNLAADQMLVTMLLADPADASNRKALERLKRKYLRRAFQTTSSSDVADAGDAEASA